MYVTTIIKNYGLSPLAIRNRFDKMLPSFLNLKVINPTL